MAGKFELYKDKAGRFRFRLKAGNGQVIAVGEAYESKTSALNGIESVRKNAGDASLDDRRTDPAPRSSALLGRCSVLAGMNGRLPTPFSGDPGLPQHRRQ